MARVRPHIKVHISVADHRKTSAIWADLAMRGMLVELWRKAGEKYAGRTADRVSLKPTDRMDIAATTDQAEADRAVTALCSALRYELRTYPNRWDVRIRKFSKKQGWREEESQQLVEQKVQRTSASESESESESNTDTEEKTRAPSAPGAGAPPRGPRRELVEKPENFPDDSRERIKAWGDSKGFGRDLLNAGLERFREWEPQKPPYRRTFKQWEGSFKKIVREGVAAGMIGKPEGKAKPAYHRDDSGQVLVPNEWRGLAG